MGCRGRRRPASVAQCRPRLRGAAPLSLVRQAAGLHRRASSRATPLHRRGRLVRHGLIAVASSTIACVSAASSSGLRATLRCVERCWSSTLQARRCETPSAAVTWSTAARRRAAPASFPTPPADLRGLRPRFGWSLQDQLLQRQVRHRPAQAAVLLLEQLQTTHLVQLQPAMPGPPAVVRRLRHPDRSDGLSHRPALADQNLDLPKLGHDLPRLVMPARHPTPPHARRPYIAGGSLAGDLTSYMQSSDCWGKSNDPEQAMKMYR